MKESLGALGLPCWTVIDFAADHGDYDQLARDVRATVERDAELAVCIERLTA